MKKHYNQTPLRDAEFITPPNILKAKVGSGGLPDEVIDNAQKIIEEHSENFQPLAEVYLQRMKLGIDAARTDNNGLTTEQEIAQILIPCVQLKANGSMFKYSSITTIADRSVQFLEVIETLNSEALDIVDVFYKTFKIIVTSQIEKSSDEKSKILTAELNNACKRFFEKNGIPVD